jgi:5-methylcytosine-specific restriction enzyme B
MAQTELLQVLRDMEQQGLKVISLEDEGADGLTIPLAEIDPFTFLASFNRGMTVENRRKNWNFLKARWDLKAPVPDDFAAIPTLNNMTSRLFPYATEREKDHVRHLWEVASLAADGDIEKVGQELFARCLKLKLVGFASLTIGLFWINPEKFLPADRKTTAYGKAKGIITAPEDYQSYRQWMKEMTERLGQDYPQISHTAHLFAVQGKSWGFTKWMGPVLDALRALGGSGTPKLVQQQIQQTLKLPDAILADKNKSGQTKFYNEINWARQYLVWEALIKSPVRGHWVLTENGKQTVLDEQQAQAIAEKWVSLHKQSPEESPDDDGSLHDTPLASAFRRYWTFAPGRDGEHWDEFYAAGIIALGWDEVSDLHNFTSQEEIRQKLVQLQPEGTSKRHDSLALWQFAHEIRRGDIVFAKQGFAKLLGYGIVEGDYIFDTERPKYKHVRRVSWLKKGEWEMPEHSKMAPKALTDITSKLDVVKLIASKVGLEIDAEPKPGVLTPPPPVGVAYWWLNANPKIWDFGALPIGGKETYTSHNKKDNKRRIYQRFLEVKPGDIVVGYVSRPQKEVVAVCRVTRGLHQTANGAEIEFEKTENLTSPIPHDTLQANADIAKSEPFVNNLQGSLFKLTEQEYEIIRSLIDDTNPAEPDEAGPYNNQQAKEGLFLHPDQFKEILDALKEKKNVVLQGAPGVGKTFIAERLAFAFIGFEDRERVKMIQFHQSYSYEDFIQGFRPTSKGTFAMKYGIFHQFCRQAQREEALGKPYVFIIDEINRGNLSKIFGELMMLMEPDKRGKKYAIPLAYSEDLDEEFYIPKNLYLLGLMNTADRSLAMVDYALRRRFRFITLKPEFDSEGFAAFLAGKGASPELVERIISGMKDLNKAIADDKNLGLGFQIGHSYFCPQDDLVHDENWYRRVVMAEIVPLLKEYWFDDPKKVEKHYDNLLPLDRR